MKHCEFCNYSTQFSHCWDKHIKTKKHQDNKKKLKKFDSDIKKIDSDKNNILRQNEFLTAEVERYKIMTEQENKYLSELLKTRNLELEDYKFKFLESKSEIKFLESQQEKDLQIINDLKEKVEKVLQENKDLKEKIDILKDRELQLLHKHIETLNQQNNVNSDCIKSSNKFINKSLDVISHITSTFKDAPALQPLNDYSLIFPNIRNTMKDIAYHKNKNIIDKYVGGIIMREYIKEDPSIQSSWTTDYSRSTFTIKQATWITDRGGIHMKDKIIKPMLCYIRRMGHEYIEQEGNTDDLEKMRELIDIREVMAKIDRDELADPINRYIAPYFCPDQNKLLMDDVKK